MGENYVVLHRSKGGYSEVHVLDFGDGYRLIVIEKTPRRASERRYWRGVLGFGDNWSKVWETTSFAKEAIIGRARLAKQLDTESRARREGSAVGVKA